MNIATHIDRGRDPREGRQQRGSALLIAVIAVTAMTMLSLGFLAVGTHFSKEQVASFDQSGAEYLAEAGVSEAMEALRSGGTGNVGTMAAPALMGNGVFWVEGTDIGNNQTRLIVNALLGSGRAALEVVVTRSGGDPLFPGILRSKRGIDIDQGATIDSFDSSLGTYASQAINVVNGRTIANQNGHIASNQEIALDVMAGVFGDANPGLGYTTTIGGGAFVTGSTTPSTDPFTIPSVDVPTWPSMGDLIVADGSSMSLASGDYHFDNLMIVDESTLTIHGPATIVVDDFNSDDIANLVIDGTNGPVTIIGTTRFNYDSNLIVTVVSGSPVDLTWMIAAGCNPSVPDDGVGEWTSYIEFDRDTQIVGGFYAPDTFIDINRDCEIWGALTADKVDMDRDLKFHFDEFLVTRTSSNVSSSSRPTVAVVSWTTTQMASRMFTSSSRDPFTLLDLDRSTLPMPADAWDM